ncbi:MAG: hypothetical protein J0M04_06215 [Verrucomicrobia bacterium]|nr:hypothetical protein [Verrucomicrobiota bacterium]
MKLHVDLETLQLIEGPGFRNPVTSLRFKRGDAAKLEVSFLTNGTTPTSIGDAAALEIRFGVKPRNRFDVGYLVHTDDWTMPAPGATNPVYQCSPSFNTTELDSALQVGSPTGTELSEITLMGEITWREGGGQPTSTRTFTVVVENDVNRGTEGVPTDAEPAYPAPGNIEMVTRKGVANGYAGLDSGGKVPASQLAITAAMISDATATGRNVLKAASQAAARSAIGALGTPALSVPELIAMNRSGAWERVPEGVRASLSAPYDYSSYPLPAHFKGMALYILNGEYSHYGYSLTDLVAYIASVHPTFWTDILLAPDGPWAFPGFAVLNGDPSASVFVASGSTYPVLTSQLGRTNPGGEVWLDPHGMAVLRVLDTDLVSVCGDLHIEGGSSGSGSY